MEKFNQEDYRSELFYRIRYVSGMNVAQSLRTDYHSSMNLIFIFFIKGVGEIKINGTVHKINAGSIILLNPSEYFLFTVDNNTFHERIVLFTNIKMVKTFPCDCSAVFSHLYQRKAGTQNIISSEIVKKYNLENLFYELLDAARDKSELSTPLSICKAIEIMCKTNKILTVIPPTNTTNIPTDSMIEHILSYVNENYTKDINIQQIADRFSIHRSYLSHKFKKLTGISLWNYVILRRIQKFNNSIVANDCLEKAAYEAGFSNYSNFFRLYKKHMGITPLEFKQQFENP